MTDSQQPITVEQLSKQTPVLGILSIVFGGISMIPLLGIVSPIGLILGIIALVKRQKITGIIGTSVSVLGVATSPILWALVVCSINPSSDSCNVESRSSRIERSVEAPAATVPQAAPVQAAPLAVAPAVPAQAAPADAAPAVAPVVAPVNAPAQGQ
jgi:hypothetical protein